MNDVGRGGLTETGTWIVTRLTVSQSTLGRKNDAAASSQFIATRLTQMGLGLVFICK